MNSNTTPEPEPAPPLLAPTGSAKLSYPQRCALKSLQEKEWQTAWDIHQPITVLKALERRGLVERRQTPGERRYFDCDDYQWRLSPNSVDMKNPQAKDKPK